MSAGQFSRGENVRAHGVGMSLQIVERGGCRCREASTSGRKSNAMVTWSVVTTVVAIHQLARFDRV